MTDTPPAEAQTAEGDRRRREMRCRALWSPFYLGKAIFGQQDLLERLHGRDSEAFIERMLEGHRKQVIEYFRGGFKTTQFTIDTSIWMILPSNGDDEEFAVKELAWSRDEWRRRMALHNQNYAQLLVFESGKNASRKVNKIREIFERNRLFQALFPEIAYSGNERPWSGDGVQIRRTEGALQEDPTFAPAGVDTALQSAHYDVIWCDDLVGEAATRSPAIMETTIDWFQKLRGVEMPGNKTWRFVVGNSWGYNDLNAWLRRKHVEYFFYTKSLWTIDEETGKEKLTFPEKYDWEAIKELREDIGEDNFWAQYMNQPRPPGSHELSTGGIHTYEIVGDRTGEKPNRIQCSCGSWFRADDLLRYIGFDPYNAKGKGSVSLPCIAVVGNADDEHTFLLDYFMVRVGYEALFEKWLEMNDQWLPHYATYEDAMGQNMFEYVLGQKEQERGFYKKHKELPPIEPVGTGGKPMELRVRDMVMPLLAANTPGKLSVHKDCQIIHNMLDTFPHRVPGHDYDLLDTLAQLVKANCWRYPRTEVEEDKQAAEERMFQDMMGEGYTWMARESGGAETVQ